MGETLKVWVATAYSGENEFDECTRAINAQKGVTIKHYVIKNRPILEAFNEMYQTWNSVADNYDAFLQVDADMVLKHDRVITTIYNRMINQLGCNHIHLPVYDHMTMNNIWGIHMYGPSLQWREVTDKNRPDKPEYHKTSRKLQLGVIHEDALVDHCPNPNFRTAFHYGWHRRLREKRELDKRLSQCLARDPKPWRQFALDGFKEADKYLNHEHDGVAENLPIEYTNEVFIRKYERILNEYQQREDASL